MAGVQPEADDVGRRLELFRVLVEQAREYGIVYLDADGRVGSWNAGAERMSGYRADEVIGRHVSIFYPEEEVAAGVPAKQLARAAADGRLDHEGWRVRKDGSRFWASVTVSAVREGGALVGFAKLTRDLTADREYREALRRSEEHLAVTLRSIGDALIATDGDGRVTLMNPVAEHLTGWTLDAARGRPLDEVFAIVNEYTRARPESPAVRALREGVIVGLANHTLLIARDGTERPIADSAAPIRDGAGMVRGVVLIFRDQTDEHAAARALRESEERLRLLIDGVKEYAIFMLDPEGRIASWNPGAARIKGYRAEEIIGRHFSVFYPPEDAQVKPPRELEEAARLGKVEDEGWRVRKDGSRFWASVVITALRDEQGRLRGFAKVTRDLSERRAADLRVRDLDREQAGRAAAESGERRLEAVLEGVADGITMQDPSGRVLFANLPAARACGFATVEELIAAPLEEIARRFAVEDAEGWPVPPDRFPGRIAVVTGQPASQLMHVLDRRSGRRWWSFVQARPVLGPDGKPEAAVNVWHDITAERRREERQRFLADAGALLASSLDYQATLEQVARLAVPRLADWCAVDVVEDAGLRSVAVTHVDPAKVELARQARARFPEDPSSPGGMHEVLRTGRARLYPEIPEALIEQAARSEEHRALIRSLQLKSVMLVPMSARGRTLGVITFVGAESGRRYDEEDLALAEELGRRAAIAVENARLYREARDAVRVRDDFLSIAGHELKTPLAAIQLHLQGLLRLAARGALPDGKRLTDRLEKAVSQGDRLEQLVGELLDVSRITAGRLKLDRERCDLGAVAREVVERFADELALAGCALALSCDGEVVGCWDRLRLDQVVTNLLSNAIKYGRGKPIDLEVARDGERARLTVRDRGIGIDPGHHARIFGRFERAVSERHYGGFGLGLWIVRQIVENHGGSIALESAPGQGARFTVELPLESA